MINVMIISQSFVKRYIVFLGVIGRIST